MKIILLRIGILGMSFIAQGFVKLMDENPDLKDVAIIVIAIIGFRLTLSVLPHYYEATKWLESEKTIVSIETLRKTTKDLTDTLVEMKRIHDEGTATRKQLSKDLSSLENEVKANVINVSNASALN